MEVPHGLSRERGRGLFAYRRQVAVRLTAPSGITTRRWLLADERGSIIAVTNDAGAAIAINTYDEYGIPASGNLGRFQYTGQMYLPEAGLYHYNARAYSPTLGRFLQPDPIGYGDGLNIYAYVRADPINEFDPTGLSHCPSPPIVQGGQVQEIDVCPPDESTSNADSFALTLGSFRIGGLTKSPNVNQPPQTKGCSAAGDNFGSQVLDRTGDLHGSIFAAAQGIAQNAGNNAGAASIGRAALPGAVILGGVSEGLGAASDHSAGMSAGRATAIHGTGFVGGLLGGVALGELVEPLGGGIPGAIIAGIVGGYGGSKVGEYAGASAATKLGACK